MQTKSTAPVVRLDADLWFVFAQGDVLTKVFLAMKKSATTGATHRLLEQSHLPSGLHLSTTHRTSP